MKKIATILGTAIAAVSFSGVANAAILNPSTFTNLTGVTDNTATTGGTLNTGDSPLGFNNTFSGNYVALGATNAQTIAVSVDNGTAVAGSTFPISASDIAAGSLIVTFNRAFGGTVGTFSNDGYSIQLFNSALGFVGSFINETSPTAASGTPFLIQGATGGSVSLVGQTPGNFTLRLVLSENGEDFPGNSAVGFSNIDVTAVPFEFSPLGLVALGGAYHFAKKNKKAKSEISA